MIASAPQRLSRRPAAAWDSRDWVLLSIGLGLGLLGALGQSDSPQSALNGLPRRVDALVVNGTFWAAVLLVLRRAGSRRWKAAIFVAAVSTLLLAADFALKVALLRLQARDSQTQRTGVEAPKSTRGVLGAESATISQSDAEALVTYGDLTDRWNRAAAPFVRDYLDPNVPATRWVQQSSTHIGELRAVVVEMHALSLAIEDPGIRRTWREIAASYKTKLECVTRLHNAVAQGDHQAEQQALQALSEANAESQRLAQALLESIRPYVGSQVLKDMLKARGKEVGDLMKPSN